MSRNIVVDLTGIRADDGCKLRYPTGRHYRPSLRAATSKYVGRVGLRIIGDIYKSEMFKYLTSHDAS